jgi:7-cyano-7-deazaguanine synthase
MTAILLSGGLDSTALAFWKKPDVAYTVNYGQVSADAEIKSSKRIASLLQIDHKILSFDLSSIGSGDLVNKEASSFAPKTDWWPFRNQILLTLTCSAIISENINIHTLIFGTVSSDSYHKDGTNEFFEAFNNLLSKQEGDIRITTPAINLSTSELVRISGITLEQISWTHSCHKSNLACGNCRGCYKHQNTMEELGWSLSKVSK